MVRRGESKLVKRFHINDYVRYFLSFLIFFFSRNFKDYEIISGLFCALIGRLYRFCQITFFGKLTLV